MTNVRASERDRTDTSKFEGWLPEVHDGSITPLGDILDDLLRTIQPTCSQGLPLHVPWSVRKRVQMEVPGG